MEGIGKFHNPEEEINHLVQRMEVMKHHRVFSMVKSLEDLRSFMEWHVFAVWDFMSLVKRLQNDFTCTTLPWVPPRNRKAARLINEIVLGEESDDTPDGHHLSHFDLYLAAMNEVDASTDKIEQFVEIVRAGGHFSAALTEIGAPEPVQHFVRSTLQTVYHGKTSQVLGSFFYGREDVIPQMFRSLLEDWSIAPEAAPMFRYYLDRHIELDADNHGPAVQSIIKEVTNGDQCVLAELHAAALIAVEQRIALWDALASELQGVREAVSTY